MGENFACSIPRRDARLTDEEPSGPSTAEQLRRRGTPTRRCGTPAAPRTAEAAQQRLAEENERLRQEIEALRRGAKSE